MVVHSAVAHAEDTAKDGEGVRQRTAPAGQAAGSVLRCGAPMPAGGGAVEAVGRAAGGQERTHQAMEMLNASNQRV